MRDNVEAGPSIYTDSLKAYDGMEEFKHHAADHAETYANGRVHTNGCENFWSLLKRSVHGTYVSVEPYIPGQQNHRHSTRRCCRIPLRGPPK